MNNFSFYDIYDEIFAKKEYGKEIDTIIEAAELSSVSELRMLEIGCGTGNHTIELAKRGFNVTAIDIDSSMIAIANGKKTKLPESLAANIQFLNCRVEELDKTDFDCCIAMFNVINYIQSLTELESFFRAVYNRLINNTHFILDSWNGIAAVISPPEVKHDRIESALGQFDIELKPSLDLMNLKCNLEYHIIEINQETGLGNKSIPFNIEHMLWPVPIILQVALKNGFELIFLRPKDDLSKTADMNDWKVLFVFKK